MARRVFGVPLVLLGFGGCQRLQATEELAAPVVAQGLFVGLELPDGYVITGDEGDILQYSAACLMFLAYVSDPSALEDAPLEAAGVAFRSDENTPLPLADEGDGKYLVTAADGLVYQPGDTALVSIAADSETASVSVDAPAAPTVDISPIMTPQVDFTVDISGQGYDNVIVLVYDIAKKKITWQNLPETVGDTYDYTHAEVAVESVTVPGSALPGEGTFLVGVAGMQMADVSTFTGANQTLSAFMAGQFAPRIVLAKF